MSDNDTSSPPGMNWRTTENPSSDDALREELRQAFDVSFLLWDWQEQWKPLESDADTSIPPDVKQAIAAVRPASEPVTVLMEDKAWLLLPLQKPLRHQGTNILAVASFDASVTPLLGRMARLFREHQRQTRVLQDTDEQMRYLAEQVSQNFEEQTYLRRLAESLELCDVSAGVKQVVERVLPELCDIIRARSMILIAPPSSNAVPEDDSHRGTVSRAVVGDPVVWAGQRRLDVNECRRLVADHCELALRQPVVRNHLRAECNTCYGEVDSFVLAPLTRKGDCLGWLLAIDKVRSNEQTTSRDNATSEAAISEDDFGTVEAGLVSAAAAMLASHGRNALLYREREHLLISVVKTLVYAIEARDAYTCGHSERVAEIARRVGHRLGLNATEAERLHMGGLLHDIGKIGIADGVLKKAGRLTDTEFLEIRRHPEFGHAILKDLTPLAYVLPGVMHHHERYDGAGYPAGLAGNSIPLAARILAVADSYDAMTSHRPYREPMPAEKVEAILRAGAGTQWDPRVIDAFFAILKEIRQFCGDYRSRSERQAESVNDLVVTGVPGTSIKDFVNAVVFGLHDTEPLLSQNADGISHAIQAGI